MKPTCHNCFYMQLKKEIDAQERSKSDDWCYMFFEKPVGTLLCLQWHEKDVVCARGNLNSHPKDTP